MFYLIFFIMMFVVYHKYTIRKITRQIEEDKENELDNIMENFKKNNVTNYCYYIYYYSNNGSTLHSNKDCRHLKGVDKINTLQLHDDTNNINKRFFCSFCHDQDTIHQLNEYYLVSNGKIHTNKKCNSLVYSNNNCAYSVFLSNEQTQVMKQLGSMCRICSQ